MTQSLVNTGFVRYHLSGDAEKIFWQDVRTKKLPLRILLAPRDLVRKIQPLRQADFFDFSNLGDHMTLKMNQIIITYQDL